MEGVKSTWTLKQMVKKTELQGGGKFINRGTENKTEEEPVAIFCSYLLLRKLFRENIFGSENSFGAYALDLKEIRLQTNFQITHPFSYIYNIFELE